MNRVISFFLVLLSVLYAQIEYKTLYFDWTSIPAYTHFASTELLESGEGEIGFGTSNFYLWSPDFDTMGYDTRTEDLLFRIGIIPHMEFGIKYSSPLALVLDLRGGLGLGKLEFTGGLGFGYMKATKHAHPGNTTLWLYDGYPAVSIGYRIFPWLRAIVTGKAILSHYIRERVDPAQNFTTIHGGYAITLEFGKGPWRVRPDFNDYWAVTHYTLAEEPIGFRARCLGISAVYRPQFKNKD